MSATSNQPANVVRWIARLGSLASLGFIGMFAFGGSEPAVWPTANEWLGLACFPIAVCLGMIAAWRWEAIGGLISLAGLAAFYVWEYSVSGNLGAGPWFLILTSPAVLFLLSAWMRQAPPSPQKAARQRVPQQ